MQSFLREEQPHASLQWPARLLRCSVCVTPVYKLAVTAFAARRLKVSQTEPRAKVSKGDNVSKVRFSKNAVM